MATIYKIEVEVISDYVNHTKDEITKEVKRALTYNGTLRVGDLKVVTMI